MIDQRIIEIVAKNYSEICLEKNEKKLKMLESMIKNAYIEGFKNGVEKAISACQQCDGIDESKKYGADVCKSCKKGAVIVDE